MYVACNQCLQHNLPGMDGVQLIVGCVALLFLSFSTVCCGETCKYLYRLQPSKGKASCNPETPLPLELRCQVMSTDDFTIQWHYSNSSSPPSVYNSTSLETVLENKTESDIMIKIVYDTSSQLSVLTLTNYSETASGHYWCTMNTTQPDQPTLNPSYVININICLFPDKTQSEELNMCSTSQVNLFEDLQRCADSETLSIGDIEKVQLGSMCAIEDLDEDVEESTTTVTDQTFSLLDQSPTSPATSGFPMRYIWMIVGIAFGVLIVIIVVILAAIIYLNHKKNKIRVFTMTRTHTHNPYIKSNNQEEPSGRETLTGVTTDEQQIRAEAGYEIPVNVIHAHNATFGGDHSPDSKTSTSSRSALQSPPGEYEEVSIVKQTRDSIKSAQRHQYELVESGDQSEYSHLQHAHGGSRKFSTNSTGTAPLSSVSQNRGKVSITSSLSLSGRQPEPIFDSPEYATIELNRSKSSKIQLPETGEGVINEDPGYSHINREAVTDRVADLEGPDPAADDSEGYHQLPSVFTGQQPNRPSEISPEQTENSHITNSHPSARRHKSATIATSRGPYTPVETTSVMKRNAYSFTIVSTDEQYVSERGHTYHLLERSDERQQNQSIPGSKEGSPIFRIQEDDSAENKEESSSLPPYSQVNDLPEQDSNKQKENEIGEEQSDSSTETSRKVIPPYSQVDKSKKKNRKPQEQLDSHDSQVNQETHHYHILEQNSEDKIEKPCGEKGGPIYHIIDHEP